MAQKKELVQFTVQNNTDCDINVPLLQRNIYSINATTKYSWNIQTIDLSCGTGSIVINSISYPFTFTANSLTSYLSALNELGAFNAILLVPFVVPSKNSTLPPTLDVAGVKNSSTVLV